MHLTGNELTGASSVVAALAIIGGYLGVRSANQNALKIAREERASKRADELEALKRATYARTMSALNALAQASMERAALKGPRIPPAATLATARKWVEAHRVAFDTIAELELASPSRLLLSLAMEAFNGATLCSAVEEGVAFARGGAKLRAALSADLRGAEFGAEFSSELDRVADAALARMAADPAEADGGGEQQPEE